MGGADRNLAPVGLAHLGYGVKIQDSAADLTGTEGVRQLEADHSALSCIRVLAVAPRWVERAFLIL